MKLTFVLLALALALPGFARADTETCAKIRTCHAELKTWHHSEWHSKAVKDARFDLFCRGDEPEFEIAPGFGVHLMLMNGDPSSKNVVEKDPHVLAQIYTKKRTYVVSSATVPANAEEFSWMYRTKPDGSSIIEVTCAKD